MLPIRTYTILFFIYSLFAYIWKVKLESRNYKEDVRFPEDTNRRPTWLPEAMIASFKFSIVFSSLIFDFKTPQFFLQWPFSRNDNTISFFNFDFDLSWFFDLLNLSFDHPRCPFEPFTKRPLLFVFSPSSYLYWHKKTSSKFKVFLPNMRAVCKCLKDGSRDHNKSNALSSSSYFTSTLKNYSHTS